MDGSVRPQLSEITVEQKLDTQCSNGIRLFIFLEADNEKNVIHNYQYNNNISFWKLQRKTLY